MKSRISLQQLLSLTADALGLLRENPAPDDGKRQLATDVLETAIIDLTEAVESMAFELTKGGVVKYYETEAFSLMSKEDLHERKPN